MSAADDAAATPPALGASAVPRLGRRQFVLGGALLAATGAMYALRPRRVAARLVDGVLDRAIPTEIGAYKFVSASGLVLPPQDEITERIYDQVLTRVYAAEDQPPMMLLVAYGSAQDYTLQAHLPEICYPSSGYTVTALSRVPVKLAPGRSDRATYLTAERPDRSEQVFYWVRIGHEYPSTLGEERLAVIKANLYGQLPDGVLVRISTLASDRTAALPQIMRFHDALLHALGPAGRALLGAGL